MKDALSRLGISLEEAQYGPSPSEVFPSWYIVLATTSADIDEVDLRNALDEVWAAMASQPKDSVPAADIQVDNQDAED
ncbi:hypothetical protein BDV41DRAFT_581589 [Aspergillus transmontanensis]|uniref:Uncharacterized protein n=1 Tax=Aspergillus transmontanensis TaxID=1034304 RepID=A0A5N6VJH7_9EURO|nr:hypothetical protein BDV41DRAFT_581589 [Aspergillus transmontanensis]